jgi:penicillin-binding protein 1B
VARKHKTIRSRSNSARKRRKQKDSNNGSFLLFILTRVLTGLVFTLFVLVLYFDYEIQQRLEGNLQSEPTHIYSRPLRLEKGSAISPERLIKNLEKLGYKRTDQISEPGEFTTANRIIDIFIRPVVNLDDLDTARAVRIMFAANRVTRLIDHSTAKEIPWAVLEPSLVGSLDVGSYKDRISLDLHQMPELLIQSLLAMEDRNFESHLGIDPKAIARAILSNLKAGTSIQGGSTITQQLVKNLFLSPERTLARKITEAIMALVLELRFSKAEILELYLNEIFLGQSGNRAVHGFALASKYFFGRPVSDLKLHETSLLVGMIPAPSYYNPHRHPERALGRRNQVLKTLVSIGVITEYTAKTASEKPLGIIPHNTDSSSDFPAYVDYLHRQLRQYYSEEVLRTDGLKLYTSLDPGIQRKAQDSLTNVLSELEQSTGFKKNTLQGAVIVVDPHSGEILGLVGDRIKGFSGFNRAIDAERPIGSLIKPAVYLTALEQHNKYSLVTILDDAPITLTPEGGEEWSPQNYDKKFRGPIPMYQGLIQSYNLPTVRLGLKIGIDQVIDTLHRLGIRRHIAAYPSILLGASEHTPLEIAQIYQTLANDGVLIPLRSIHSIQNYRGDIVARYPVSENRVIDQDSSYLINRALQMVVSQGTAIGLGRSFSPELGLSGKTGTTDNYRDSWFSGYSGNLLTVVWVGRDDNKPTKLSGSSGAMRVWENLMQKLDQKRRILPENNDIVYATVDIESGLVANNKCPARISLPFVKGSQPESFAPCSGLAAKLKSWFSIDSGNDVSSGISIDTTGNK